ncbi:MAG TPA: DUF6476 family protein [Rhizomicrobium sp.]|nr:DUF6476 family protein [Rhizomicrobium sp.]
MSNPATPNPASFMPANDDPNAPAAPNYKIVRAIVIILGVLIVLAFAALVWGFIARLAGHGPGALQPTQDYVLPQGAKILQVTPAANSRLIMAVQTASGSEVYVFDTDTGQVVLHVRPRK